MFGKKNKPEKPEIDLLAFSQKLWNNKKIIIKVSIIGMIIGVVIAFSIPKEYTTKVILMPEAQSSGRAIGSLAALAGLNLDGASGINVLASPDLYPNVLQSTPFVKGLFDIKVVDAEQDINTTLYDYLNNHQKRTWWSYILGVPSFLISLLSPEDDNIAYDAMNNDLFISKEEMSIIDILKEQVVVYSDNKTAVTSIEVTMQSAEISAYIADTLTSYFQSYIIDYRTQKARNDLVYAEKLYLDSKNNYHQAQQQLAAFVEGNLKVVSPKYLISQERYQNEANLAYSVYSQTAQQLQLARVKVQDNTPVFTVIQPSVQPLTPSKPSKKLIVIGFIFLAFTGSSTWILRKDLHLLL